MIMKTPTLFLALVSVLACLTADARFRGGVSSDRDNNNRLRGELGTATIEFYHPSEDVVDVDVDEIDDYDEEEEEDLASLRGRGQQQHQQQRDLTSKSKKSKSGSKSKKSKSKTEKSKKSGSKSKKSKSGSKSKSEKSEKKSKSASKSKKSKSGSKSKKSGSKSKKSKSASKSMKSMTQRVAVLDRLNLLNSSGGTASTLSETNPDINTQGLEGRTDTTSMGLLNILATNANDEMEVIGSLSNSDFGQKLPRVNIDNAGDSSITTVGKLQQLAAF